MAIRLSDSDSHLDYTGTSPLTNNGALTVEFRATVTSWASTSCLVGVYDAGATPSAGIQVGPRNNNAMNAWLWGGTTLLNSGILVSNTSYHTTLTIGSGTASIYIDGVLSAATAYSGTYTFHRIYVNGYPTSTTETSSSLFESLAVYGRVLSDSEIKTIAASRGYRHGIVDGLVAKYDFIQNAEGTTASSVPDLSGNGRVLSHVGTSPTLIKYTYAGAYSTANLRRVM